MKKVRLTWEDIFYRIRSHSYPQADAVVGIAEGGVVPATLIAFHLNIPFYRLHISFRDVHNKPRQAEPQLIRVPALPEPVRTVLLVDDVSVTGETMRLGTRALPGYQVIPLVLKGKGPHVLFPEITACVDWPWKNDGG